jgi:cysteine desulfurase
MVEVKTPVYLDYQATTPMDPLVLEAMMPFFTEKFGNPHSNAHRFGWEASAAIEVARGHIASTIGASAEEIIFTSGATEANNLAIKGIMAVYGKKRPRLLSVVSEHKCLIESANAMARNGYEVNFLPVEADGLLDLNKVEAALDDNTALLSVMAVNNEIGVIQPLEALGALAHARGALFHSDAAQAFGKIPLDVGGMNVDLMSLSAHKIYGPKGIGALYLRSKPRVAIRPLIDGGAQEKGLRSGTLAPALCVGFGKAAEIAHEVAAKELRRVNALAATFRGRVLLGCPGAIVNGSLDERFAGNLNMSFPGLDGDRLISELRELAVSSGAACASATTGPSYVLEAIGLSADLARSSIRFGFGRFTSEDEILFAADTVVRAVLNMQKKK